MEAFKRKVLQKFLQIIRQAFSSVVSDDTSEYPQGQATSNGKATNITRLSTYGVIANPPLDSHILMFQSQGQESTKFGLYNDFLNRKKELAEGECALYNTLTGAIVHMKGDGSINVESPTSIDAKAPVINIEGDSEVNVNAPVINAVANTINATAPTISMTGAVTIAGTLVVTGTIAAAGLSGGGGAPISMPDGADIGGIAFDAHVHGGVQSGGSNTGVPQ